MNRLSFNGKELKWIAMCSMLIDHIGFLLMPAGLPYVMFRTVGRLAFPLFSFLLVEGFLHSRDKTAYGRNLLLFAVISEIPFNLACNGTIFFPAAQNVFFTLFLGLLLLTVLQKTETFFRLPAVLLFAALSWLFRCDYQAYGILLIALLYWYRTQQLSIAVPAFFAAFLSLSFFCAAALSMIPIYYYDGTRGFQRHKYFYYLFYPLHLLILFLFSVWLR